MCNHMQFGFLQWETAMSTVIKNERQDITDFEAEAFLILKSNKTKNALMS